MQLKINRLLPVIIFAVSAVTACKKTQDVAATTTPTPTPVAVTTDPEKIKDSTLLYSKDVYLWYNQIPSTFDARSFADPVAIMTAIRQYSIEPGFSAAVDRWSFAMKKTDWDNLSGGLGTTFGTTSATNGDFGLGVFFNIEGDLRVKSVEKESPSGLAGVRRGWRITKINGSTNITTSNASVIVDAVYNSTQSTFTFIKPDGNSVDIILTTAHYQEHPVYLDTVYTVNSKKTGYLVFNSFLGDTTEIYSEFNRVFNKFASQNVSDVVIDLRYNGGGYVSVQEKLADYLVSSSSNNNLMMKEQYNDKNSAYNSSTYFKKLGSLNLSRIFFIVTSGTASASELLINNLKPYMDVKLIGPTNTHGKPVGFFPIPVGDWYIFPVSFRSTNANGNGNYFSGFAPDSKVNDGLTKDWGDITELCLASVIKYINSGAFRLSTETFQDQLPEVKQSNLILDEPSFKGTISTGRTFK
ncbi:MAG TPA: S41 family peptidase [Chitinophagaceae bacterium]